MRNLIMRGGLLIAMACFSTQAAGGQNPVAAYPQNYKLVLDNRNVAVLRVHYGAHETVGLHDHSAYTTVYIYLNDSGPVLFHHEEAKPFEITRPPTHTGAFRVSPGRIERHSVKDLGDVPSDFLRVELKRMPIRTLRSEFRGAAPALPLAPGTTEAYRTGPLLIQRTICAASSDCELPASPYPSVLVAVQPLALSSGTNTQALDFAQPAAWIPAATQASLHNNGSAPAQALRLVLRRQ